MLYLKIVTYNSIVERDCIVVKIIYPNCNNDQLIKQKKE